MTPAERIAEIRTLLSTAYAHLDALSGELEEPEGGAALELRADVGLCLRRAKALAIFVGQRKAS